LSLTLGTGASSLQVQHRFLVTDDPPSKKRDLISMRFFTDFECELDIDSQSTITLSRTPREPLACYRRPILYADLRLGKGQPYRTKVVVDTGGHTDVVLAQAKSRGLKLRTPFKKNGRQYYKVKDTVRFTFGSHSCHPKEV
jgi:hypothetical protein